MLLLGIRQSGKFERTCHYCDATDTKCWSLVELVVSRGIPQCNVLCMFGILAHNERPLLSPKPSHRFVSYRPQINSHVSCSMDSLNKTN